MAIPDRPLAKQPASAGADTDSIPGPDHDPRVAYHEAGHAVARFISGLTIRRVTIEASEADGITFDGHIVPTRMPNHGVIPVFYGDGMRRWRRLVLRDLEFACAGIAAEFLAFPELDGYGTQTYFLGTGDGSDFSIAKRLARLVGLAEAGMVEPGEERIMGIIGESLANIRDKLNRLENWWQIKTLAELLLERRTLSGRDAKSVCDRARRGVLAVLRRA